MGKQVDGDHNKLLRQLIDDVSIIKKHLVNSEVKPLSEYLTVDEWCKAAKCSRWVWEVLKNNNLIDYKKKGRRFIIPSYTVSQYLEGEIKLPPINS